MLRFGNRGYKCLNHITRLPLTSEEKRAIQERWGKCVPDPTIGYDQYAIYKQLCGFDVDFVPNAYFHPYVAKYLFHDSSGRVLSNKNMLWSFLYGIPQAETVLRKCENVFFDAQGNNVGLEQGIGIVKSCLTEMIIKPTIDSCGGKSILLLTSRLSESEIREVLTGYDSNFIVQQKVKQSPAISRLNESSLNTIRVNTLYLNGKFSVTTMGIRIGKQGSIVDNASSDGVMAGIRADGTLKPCAYDLHGNKLTTVNGIELCAVKIPHIDQVMDLCIRAHKRMMQSRMIAWDIALTENDKPLVLEANVGYTHFYPGIRAIQLCNGPVFGDRTQEVIDYVAQMQRTDREHGRKLVVYTESK